MRWAGDVCSCQELVSLCNGTMFASFHEGGDCLRGKRNSECQSLDKQVSIVF